VTESIGPEFLVNIITRNISYTHDYVYCLNEKYWCAEHENCQNLYSTCLIMGYGKNKKNAI